MSGEYQLRWGIAIDILYEDAPPKREFFVDICNGIIVTSPDQRQAWIARSAVVLGVKLDEVNNFIREHKLAMLEAESEEIHP